MGELSDSTPLGTIGGRYALCGRIASGGMATVHLARQLGAGGFARIVAVKRLHERYARDPEFVAMFLDEARIVARIRHPNVVQTIDVVTEDFELFLVMEYIHGESLLHMMHMASREKTPLPIPVVGAVLVGALLGLHEAHDARSETGVPLGIVHRDVSPHNVLVGVDGTARVLDFGVAKASERIQTTLDGQLKGKLSYMAPEQITNQPMDRRTDVYSAAVVLWEALTGLKLFHGASEGAVINKILLETVRPPSRLNASVPAALDAVVMRGLARDPSARFGSAREMAVAIEQATPLASASVVGALLSASCEASVATKAQLIASIEARSSTSNMREAVDSLRNLTSSRTGSAPVQTVPPATCASMPPGSLPKAAPAATLPPPDARSSDPRLDSAGHISGGHVSGGIDSGFPMAKGAIGEVPVVCGKPADGGRMVVAIVASLLLVASVLAAGGYLVVARRGAVKAPSAKAPSATPSAASASGSAPAETASSAAVSSVATVISCPAGMALVPGGRFFMGSDDDLSAERPAHKVALHAYCMDKREVTSDAYRACSDRGDCKRASVANKWDDISAKDSHTYDPLCNAQNKARGSHPINCVDWNMADRFCKAEGKRLPTEAEWEFAARGSDGRKYPWGDAVPSVKHLNACGAECVGWGKKRGTVLEALFTESDSWQTTAPVGSFPLGASLWGIEDMVGNVWEWVADYYAPYTEADQADPAGPTSGATRGMRGGAWNGAYADWVRPSFRFHGAPDMRSHGVGFRCAL